jgi:anti-anti-sigma factor
MTTRSRHGLHAVRDGDAPRVDVTDPAPRDHGSVRVDLQSVVLAVAGRLTADTAGRLRMFLSMFTVDGGPRELVLDLSDVSAVDGDGMAPIAEAAEVLGLRGASLRLTSVSTAVAHVLDTHGDLALLTGRPSLVPGGRGTGPGDDDPGPWSGLR